MIVEEVLKDTSLGSLRRLHLKDHEMYVFLTILANKYNTCDFDVLANVFEEDFFLFLDMFCGETIKIPSRKEIERFYLYTKIYSYVQNRPSKEEAIKSLCRIYSMSAQQIEKILDHVEKALSSGGVIDGEEE